MNEPRTLGLPPLSPPRHIQMQLMFPENLLCVSLVYRYCLIVPLGGLGRQIIVVILQAVSLRFKENKLLFQLLVSGRASITPTQVSKLQF